MPEEHEEFESMTVAIRHAIETGGVSFNELERETGVLRQSLMKFARGEQTIHLDSADRLAEYFGIQVTRPGSNAGTGDSST